jgi:integrase
LKKRLTNVVLGALRASVRPYYVSDDQQSGLRVRVATSGALTWNVAYRIKGVPSARSTSLGPCDAVARNGLGLAEARERAAAILKAARQGRDLLQEEREVRRVQKNLLSVAALIERYSTSIRNPNRQGGPLRTALDIERRLKRALFDKLEDPANDLSRGDIGRLLDPVADSRPREAEKRRQAIGAMYRWGVAKGFVLNDPTEGAERYGRGDLRNRVLDQTEIRTVWRWLEAGADGMPVDCIAVLKIQMCLGARVGEIAGMDVTELSREDHRLLWTLPSHRSKNKNMRVTPLVGIACELVDAALRRHERGPLFRAALSNRALGSSDLGHALKKRTLPVPHFTTHDLRRTVVSQMDEMGIALDTIAAVIGHQRGSKATRTLIRHYSRPRLDERVHAALSAWDDRLRGLLGERAHELETRKCAPLGSRTVYPSR